MLHPQKNVSGNILWPGELPSDHLASLPAAFADIRAQGYFASAFPEGDGITFNSLDRDAYDPELALRDFRAAFPFLDLWPVDPDEGHARALARLARDRTAKCRYLVPVEGLRLETPFQLGDTRFHAPVDGASIRLADHAWRDLCEVPGADVIKGWAPGRRGRGTTELLAYPLIERSIEVPLSTFYEAGHSYDSQSGLLRLLMEDADHALDPVRFALCHYKRLHYLPAKPGWVADTALTYLLPESRALKARFLQGKPYVLRAANNWLGLEVDSDTVGTFEPLAALVDSTARDDVTLALKSALRAWNRAFYLIELEASFLHLVYAVDALCEPQALRGERHRLWITAFASGGDATRFATLLSQFNQHYAVRNAIVHEGQSFAELALVGEDQCQFMLELLASCIETFLHEGFATRQAAADFAFDVLTSTAITALISAAGASALKLPLTVDKIFNQHMARP